MKMPKCLLNHWSLQVTLWPPLPSMHIILQTFLLHAPTADDLRISITNTTRSSIFPYFAPHSNPHVVPSRPSQRLSKTNVFTTLPGCSYEQTTLTIYPGVWEGSQFPEESRVSRLTLLAAADRVRHHDRNYGNHTHESETRHAWHE